MDILFIDDDIIRTEPLRESLKVLGGFDVLHFRTPYEGVEKFKENPESFHAVIVDIMLPHYNMPEYRDFSIPRYFSNNIDGMFTGLKVLIQFREIMNEKNIKIPLIVLTCIEDIYKYLNELNLKVDRILIKPIFLADFIREVKDVVQS